MHIIFC